MWLFSIVRYICVIFGRRTLNTKYFYVQNADCREFEEIWWIQLNAYKMSVDYELYIAVFVTFAKIEHIELR